MKFCKEENALFIEKVLVHFQTGFSDFRDHRFKTDCFHSFRKISVFVVIGRIFKKHKSNSQINDYFKKYDNRLQFQYIN